MSLVAGLPLMGANVLTATGLGPAAMRTIKTAATGGARDGLTLSLGLAIGIAPTAAKALVCFATVFIGLMPLDSSLALGTSLIALICGMALLRSGVLLTFFSRPASRSIYPRTKSWLDHIFGGLVKTQGVRIVFP